MARQKGSDVLLKLDTTGSSNYVTIGGIQNARITLDRGDADVTNQGSPSKHRELLEAAGIFKMSVSGDGVFDSAAPQDTLRSIMMQGLHRNWQVIVPGQGTYSGAFMVTKLEFGGPHEKEVTMQISLESAGLISFV
jgi:TP901-1 family phage major tail protein